MTASDSIRCGAACLLLSLMIAREADGSTTAYGYLSGHGVEKFINLPGDYENVTTSPVLPGTITTKATLAGIGDWYIRMITSSTVTHTAIGGGYYQVAQARMSTTRTNRLESPIVRPYPSTLTVTGEFSGRVDIEGPVGFHDGSLQFGSTSIGEFEDLYVTNIGGSIIRFNFTETVPVSAEGEFTIAYMFESFSYSKLGNVRGYFFGSLGVTSILLPNGNTPESEGWTMIFEDGLSSPNISADFNLDHVVDSADLLAWSGHFGLLGSAVRADGDANLDRNVDGADFLVWQRQLGSGASLSASPSVPEPSALALLLLAGCGLKLIHAQRS